ncbi:hypothetical protein B0A48_12003 [Cryoendolithus antarcticus]|uniref:Ribosomal protein S21 n=1 Tax=Cryoendolithus antarcticus TaxID=1507870 RepID=A0A1V8STK9_9PEZI|nr:hypothetical protein B0A48_12003 [Cryoendolithus antarcticus]
MECLRLGEASMKAARPLLQSLVPQTCRHTPRRNFIPQRQSQRRTIASTARRRADNKDPFASLLDEALSAPKASPSRSARPSPPSSSSKGVASSMDDLFALFDSPKPPPGQAPTSRSSAVSSALRSPLPPVPTTPPLKLDAAIGRKVYVNKEKGFDVAKAFRSMEINVARNGVKRDFNRQRFHERGGVKRKRLKSERWRKNFREGFRAVVRRVLRMRGQGW